MRTAGSLNMTRISTERKRRTWHRVPSSRPSPTGYSLPSSHPSRSAHSHGRQSRHQSSDTCNGDEERTAGGELGRAVHQSSHERISGLNPLLASSCRCRRLCYHTITPSRSRPPLSSFSITLLPLFSRHYHGPPASPQSGSRASIPIVLSQPPGTTEALRLALLGVGAIHLAYLKLRARVIGDLTGPALNTIGAVGAMGGTVGMGMDLALDARTMNATEVTLAHDGAGDPRDLLAFSAMMRLQATRYLARACQCPDEIQSDAALGATMAVVLIEACLSLFSFQRLGEPWWAAHCVCGVPDRGHDKYRLRNGEIDIESVHIQTFGISRGVDTAKS
jgi:hypothetical protein